MYFDCRGNGIIFRYLLYVVKFIYRYVYKVIILVVIILLG